MFCVDTLFGQWMSGGTYCQSLEGMSMADFLLCCMSGSVVCNCTAMDMQCKIGHEQQGHKHWHHSFFIARQKAWFGRTFPTPSAHHLRLTEKTLLGAPDTLFGLEPLQQIGCDAMVIPLWQTAVGSCIRKLATCICKCTLVQKISPQAGSESLWKLMQIACIRFGYMTTTPWCTTSLPRQIVCFLLTLRNAHFGNCQMNCVLINLGNAFQVRGILPSKLFGAVVCIVRGTCAWNLVIFSLFFEWTKAPYVVLSLFTGGTCMQYIQYPEKSSLAS